MVGGFDHLVEDVAELRHRRLEIGLSSNDLISVDYDLFDGVLGREWRMADNIRLVFNGVR